MKGIHHNKIINIVAAFVAVTLFFCCQSEEEKQEVAMNYSFTPVAKGIDINLKYTDSGKLKAVLKSPTLIDYTNLNFGFWEFPNGIALDLLEKNGSVSTIRSDYAISYKETGLIDMRGNVKITTADSTYLEAQQLYYDQNINWLFTDLPYKSKLPDGTINNGFGFDANQDFSILNSRSNEGVMFVEEE